MVKCRSISCTKQIDSVLGGGVHKHTGERYCGDCARAHNAAFGTELIVIPKFNVNEPNVQNVPRKP